MRAFSIFLALMCSFNFVAGSAESEVVAEAIIAVLTDYFAKHCPKVDLLYFGDVHGQNQVTSENILRKKPDDVSIRYASIHRRKAEGQMQLSAPTILIFDSMEHFHGHLSKIAWMSRNGVWHKHLVYAPGLTSQGVLQDHNTSISMSEVNFLTNFDGSSIKLTTAFMYTKDLCAENQMRTINRFSVRKQRWEDTEFYPDKYRNFHGCVLEVYVNFLLNLLGEKIFENLATQFNFTVDAVIATEDYDEKKFNQLSDNIWFRDAMSGDTTQFHVSNTLYMDELTIMVPAGLPLTDLEKMFVMFDSETWIAIGFTFTVAFLTIQVLNWMSRKIQNFVFGRNIRTPTLNLLSTFLNGGQITLPGRNFARFLLMMFMIWSLIIRTCYQSKMFENLQSDMRHPRVKTFADFNEMNFTLLIQLDENQQSSAGWQYLLDGKHVSIYTF